MTRVEFARWLQPKLLGRTRSGGVVPPGGEVGMRIAEPDGRELAVVGCGDGLDVYFADKRSVVAFALTPGAALRLAVWVLLRWWVVTLWGGLRLRAWLWALRVGAPMRVRKWDGTDP